MTEAGGLRVGLLGPVLVSRDGVQLPVPAGLGVLLAALALSANRVVSADALIATIWADDESRDRERNLHTRVYQVRKLLAAADLAGQPTRLVTQAPGYRLNLAAAELDVTMFDNLAADGRAAVRASDSKRAAELFTAALELWRGAPIADVSGLSARLAAASTALEERRLAVVEDKIEAELDCGRHSELTPELVALAAAHPLRERLRGQLMLALYRSGRQADALEVYQQTRLLLADELGIDPGPQLRALQQRILRSDPDLLLADAASEPEPGRSSPQAPGLQAEQPEPSRVRAQAQDREQSQRQRQSRSHSKDPDHSQPASRRGRTVPRQLPASVRSFAGRQAELTALRSVIQAQSAPHGTVVISAIGGTGGVGKTALALHWAHRVADRFPDGQLFVNLRGYDPASPPLTPAQAIRGFLDALGVPGEAVPVSEEARAGLYRSLVADRRLLIVLDNARDPAQIRPLLPASAGSLVLVTSRSPLHGLAATDNMTAVPLGLVSQEEAAGILAARLGQERLDTEPSAVADLIRRCCRLPLALAIVAARAAARPDVPLAVLADAMADQSGVLDELDTGDPSTSLRHVLSWSYAQLSAVAARMFRLLSVQAGPDIAIPAAASLAALSRPAAKQALVELTDAGLLTEQKPGRYSFHDLLRAYATEQAGAVDSQPELVAATGRVLDHYLHTAHPACQLLSPIGNPIQLDPAAAGVAPESVMSYQGALAWFTAEEQVLMGAARLAADSDLARHAWQLAWTMRNYLSITGNVQDWLSTTKLAYQAAARLDDQVALGWAEHRLGVLAVIAGDLTGALARQHQALAHFKLAGDQSGQGTAERGIAYALALLGETAAAYDHSQRAIELYRAADDLYGLAISLSDSGALLVQLGDGNAGLDLCEQSLGYCRQLGSEIAAAAALAGIGDACRSLADYDRAIDCHEQAVASCASLGVTHALADYLYRLGISYDAAGRPADASSAWHRVLDLYGDEYRRDQTDVIRARLAELQQAQSG